MSGWCVLPSQLSLPERDAISGILRCTAGMCLENRWFATKTAERIHPDVMNYRLNKMGTQFKAPRLFVKNSQDVFSVNYVIQYTETKGDRETFRFKRLYVSEGTQWSNEW